jgi:hypothetical protein
MTKRKVFISYHHANDQKYKKALTDLNEKHNIFIDMSVELGDIPDDLPDQSIRKIIRDEYLKDSTILILLVGSETKNRKHIDWEIYSSMYDGEVNKKMGILIITLPEIFSYSRVSSEEEKKKIYPNATNWITLETRKEYEEKYPHMPARVIDNFLKKNVKISVVNWEHINGNPNNLSYLINEAYENKSSNEYDLSRAMRKNNS